MEDQQAQNKSKKWSSEELAIVIFLIIIGVVLIAVFMGEFLSIVGLFLVCLGGKKALDHVEC